MSAIEKVIDKYIEEFPNRWNKQKYLWEAVAHFQKYWDIEATDFALMFEKATEKTNDYLNNNHLLEANGFRPRKNIIKLAKMDGKSVQNMFITLYDESIDMFVRVEKFINDWDELAKRSKSKMRVYQELVDVSIYISLLCIRKQQKN